MDQKTLVLIWSILILSLVLRLLGDLMSSVYRAGETIKITGTIEREPYFSGNHQILMLENLRVVAAAVPLVHYGDKLTVSGVVICDQARGKDSCLPELYEPRLQIVGVTSPSSILSPGKYIKDHFRLVYRDNLNSSQADLLSGVLLGNSGLDCQFRTKLANVGLSHVVAASGMNVTMVSGFVFWVLSGFRINKRLIVGLSILLIVFYCTVTGFDASIVRAAFMTSFAFVGASLGRQGGGYWGLAVAAYVMLWADPSLLGDFGFLLSFTSMAGQLSLGTLRSDLPVIKKLVIGNFYQSFVSVVFTLPIVLVGFSRFSLVTLLTNLLVLPIVGPLMILGALAGVSGMLSVVFSHVFTSSASVLLDYFLWVVNFFNRRELVVRTAQPTWLFAVGYYMLLLVFWYWAKSKLARIVTP